MVIINPRVHRSTSGVRSIAILTVDVHEAEADEVIENRRNERSLYSLGIK
jgi:hypothetical protein